MAIKRHEFHPQSFVASATPVFEADRNSVSASVSPSLLAFVRGTTARSAVSVSNGSHMRSSVSTGFVATRHRVAVPAIPTECSHDVAFVPVATSFHDTSCVSRARFGAVTRLACTATPAAAAWQSPHYVCLLEAA